MAAIICQITEAIAQVIQAETFAVDLTASAGILPIHKLPDLTSRLNLDVIPFATETVRIDRASFQINHEINLVLQKKVSSEEEVPAFLEVIEQLSAFFFNRVISGDGWKVVIIGSEVPELYDGALLYSDGLFQSAVTLKVKRLS